MCRSQPPAHRDTRPTENPGGDAVMTCHQVFPGIQLIYNDIHTTRGALAPAAAGTLMEIHYCREGRLEGEVQDEFYYLAPGDLSIRQKGEGDHLSHFPVGHYHGITVAIDIQKAPPCLSCFLDDVNVRPAAILEKFCQGNTCFVARSNPHLEHIFTELYAVPDSIRKGYCKVKILELLLFLSNMQWSENETPARCLPKKQVALAKEICRHLTDQLDSRVTIDQLAQRFHLSQTALKTCFKGVYGTSIPAYLRELRMHTAAALLRDTDQSVLEIAGRCGYDNPSKFAGAFRSVMGLSPAQYRTKERNATPYDDKQTPDCHPAGKQAVYCGQCAVPVAVPAGQHQHDPVGDRPAVPTVP